MNFSNTKKIKNKLKKLFNEKTDNWRGKIYQQLQLHGETFFTELELSEYPTDYRDIMNCLCKVRLEDEYLAKECETPQNNDYEYKQSEIDKTLISKELCEEIMSTFNILCNDKYFVIYIPNFNIMMIRVKKYCDFFVMDSKEEDSKECKIICNCSIDEHIESVKKKESSKKLVPIICFYI
jgi:hypothetical protein